MIRFFVITLFPDMFSGVLGTSMMRKASENGLAEFHMVDLREYGIGAHKKVDDTPYGGGDGMIFKPEPVFAAVEEIKAKYPEAIVALPTPRGEIWTQKAAEMAVFGDFTRDVTFILICPHYEGYDERIASIVDLQFCIGKYVLTGGEIPAMVFIDSMTRLVPGVLGGETSVEIESFSHGENIEWPQYTRPEEFRGMKVPEVLLSGHHANIEKWRQEQGQKISDTRKTPDF